MGPSDPKMGSGGTRTPVQMITARRKLEAIDENATVFFEDDDRDYSETARLRRRAI